MATVSAETVSLRRACQYLGTSPYKFMKIVLLKGIRIDAQPGQPARYSWADIQRIGAEMGVTSKETAA